MREIAKAHGVSFDKLAVGQNVFETGKSDACGLQCADAVDIWHEEVHEKLASILRISVFYEHTCMPTLYNSD